MFSKLAHFSNFKQSIISDIFFFLTKLVNTHWLPNTLILTSPALT